MKRLYLATAALFIASTGRAESVENAFPIMRFHPETVNLVYPGFNVAAGVNPAALPSAGRGTAIQAGFSPGGSDESRAFASVAHAADSLGVNAGYQGRINGGMAHDAFLGVGGTFGNFSLGLALREFDISGGFNPSLDAGMVVELKVVDFGLVFYDLNGSPRLGIGVGSRSGGSFTIEGNVLLPHFNNLGGGYLITAAAQIAVQIVRVHFRTSYDTGWNDFSHTVGLGAWVTPQVLIGMQYSTPRRVSAAVTFTI